MVAFVGRKKRAQEPNNKMSNLKENPINRPSQSICKRKTELRIFFFVTLLSSSSLAPKILRQIEKSNDTHYRHMSTFELIHMCLEVELRKIELRTWFDIPLGNPLCSSKMQNSDFSDPKIPWRNDWWLTSHFFWLSRSSKKFICGKMTINMGLKKARMDNAAAVQAPMYLWQMNRQPS